MDSSESLREALAAGDAFRRLDRLRATAPLFPRDARIWFHYARVAQEVGNEVEMRDALRCGLALDPEGWRDAGLELPEVEHQRIESLMHALGVRDASDRLVHLRRVHERWPDDVIV